MMYALLIYGDDSPWVDLLEDERARLRAEEIPEWNLLFDELRKSARSSPGDARQRSSRCATASGQ
jgi:hypothetical protein